MTAIAITRAGPLTTLQDAGRFGMLKHGVSASGPMDREAYRAAGAMLPAAGSTAIELAQGLAFTAEGAMTMASAGGLYVLKINRMAGWWGKPTQLREGDEVDISPGEEGNYGYLRFARELDVPLVLGSRSTNVAVGLGGWKGRPLRAGDRLVLGEPGTKSDGTPRPGGAGPIRILWGLHAGLFDPALRERLATTAFAVSTTLDRMGVRLDDPAGLFHGQRRLNLVSDAIVPGDIQIVGDGVPVVLMRDHQPTGGYPRIATVAGADLDRFAQMRPGAEVRFRPISLEHAR